MWMMGVDDVWMVVDGTGKNWMWMMGVVDDVWMVVRSSARRWDG
jgi:hypothetical protein